MILNTPILKKYLSYHPRPNQYIFRRWKGRWSEIYTADITTI